MLNITEGVAGHESACIFFEGNQTLFPKESMRSAPHHPYVQLLSWQPAKFDNC